MITANTYQPYHRLSTGYYLCHKWCSTPRDKNSRGVGSRCGHPGRPGLTNLDPEKSVYEEGEEVQFSCALHRIYQKRQMKACVSGHWIGNRTTCGHFLVNQVMRVKVIDLQNNETVVDVNTIDTENNRTCVEDYSTRQWNWKKVFWFWCTESKGSPNNTLSIRFTTYANQPVKAITLNDVYLSQLRYCGYPTVPPMTKYVKNNEKDQLECDSEVSYDINSYTPNLPMVKHRVHNDCVGNQYFAGRPKCVPKMFCKLQLNNETEEISSVTNAYIFNESKWYAIEGTQVYYRCKIGYKLFGESVRTCGYNSTWDQTTPICKAIDSKDGPKNQFVSSGVMTAIIIIVVVIVIMIALVVVIIGMKRRIKNQKTRETNGKKRNSYDDIQYKNDDKEYADPTYDETKPEANVPNIPYYLAINGDNSTAETNNNSQPIGGRCGHPGLPHHVKLFPVKNVYEDGDEVRYTCPTDSLYLKTQTKKCVSGEWTGPRTTCGYFFRNKLMRVKVIKLQNNDTVVDVNTSKYAVSQYQRFDRSCFYDFPATAVLVTDPHLPHEWHLEFEKFIAFDFLHLYLKIPTLEIQARDTDKIDLIKVRDMRVVSQHNRTCAEDFSTRADEKKVFWFWCTDSNGFSNNSLSIRFITYATQQAVKTIGLEQVYLSKLQYCGHPSVPLLAKYVPQNSERQQIQCDPELSYEINSSVPVLSNQYNQRVISDCVDNEYFAGRPKCVPKMVCEIQLNNESEEIISVRKTYKFNESKWYAIEGTQVYYKCKTGCYRVGSRCGHPGLPHNTNINLEKHVYEDGEEVQYSCPSDQFYRKKQIKKCVSGEWTGGRSTCGLYIKNQLMRVKVVNLQTNKTVVNVDTSNYKNDRNYVSFQDESGTAVSIRDAHEPHEWHLQFANVVRIDLINIYLKIPSAVFEASIHDEIDFMRFRDMRVDSEHNRTCALDFHTLLVDGKIESNLKLKRFFWFWCTASKGPPNNTLSIRFTTYGTPRAVKAIGLNRVYLTQLRYCGYPTVPLFTNYVLKDNKKDRLECDPEVAYDITNTSDMILSETKTTNDCEVNEYWSGRPQCVPKMFCKLQLNNESEEISSVKNAYIFNESKWYAIEGTHVYYRCKTGYELLSESLRTCGYNSTWDQKTTVCQAIGFRDGPQNHSVSSGVMTAIVIVVVVIVIIVSSVVVIIVRRSYIRNKKLKVKPKGETNGKERNSYDDIQDNNDDKEYADPTYDETKAATNVPNMPYYLAINDDNTTPELMPYYLTITEDNTNEENMNPTPKEAIMI
ncbi:unnamed protein product [Medioppia subpectinata]|uniref:Sushi domain-containing protein n=1 Tax=Medioppia subpectinata TaxID=1979941 RepID=A0A7R9PYJ1_9ACAR|nr:unnamed protein product [Medioppia subpectinata]CAG2105949.1 unnamed protein product [Medioppia subpectinata]